MDRRSYLAGVSTLGAGLTAGCVGTLVGDTYDIGMDPEAFVPEEYTVEVGTTVVWRNTSSRGHTVTAYGNGIPEDATYFASGGFDSEKTAREEWNSSSDSGMIFSGEEYEHTFETPGEFHYVCLPHERASMVGTIIVEDTA